MPLLLETKDTVFNLSTAYALEKDGDLIHIHFSPRSILHLYFDKANNMDAAFFNLKVWLVKGEDKLIGKGNLKGFHRYKWVNMV